MSFPHNARFPKLWANFAAIVVDKKDEEMVLALRVAFLAGAFSSKHIISEAGLGTKANFDLVMKMLDLDLLAFKEENQKVFDRTGGFRQKGKKR